MNTTPEHRVVEALAMQARASAALGSAMYGHLFERLASRYRQEPATGLLHGLLDGRSQRPVHDALALRLAGAVHRIVLRGDAPTLAPYYPSTGGSPTDGWADEFVDVVERHRDEVSRALGDQVQTNEVGRSAVLAGGFALLSRRFGLPLELFELGASAGLNLRWDGYRYDTGATTMGDPASDVAFTENWSVPPVLSSVEVIGRSGCDIAPLDAGDAAAHRRLLSFVWPDQRERFVRLRAALAVAEQMPVDLHQADAGVWLSERLPRRRASATTVVYHSIVWQYLPPATKDAVRAALVATGEQATPASPLTWLRMEPAGPVADLRLTTWPGGTDEVLATASFHGNDIRWLGAHR